MSSVNVRISHENSQIVNLSGLDKVKDVKHILAERLDLDANNFNLLFSGKFLEPETSLQDLCLGAQSVLHVFPRKPKTVTSAHESVQENKTLSISESRSKQYQYFVYCKVCSGLYPGKLRVRCGKCLHGAIVLDQEPRSWEDVLQSGKISGHCSDCDSVQTAQFYFKCCNHDGDEECSPLQQICPNRRHIECTVCTEERSPVLVYTCEDKHVICLDCFVNYARMSLDQGTFIGNPEIGYSLPCPVGCDDSLIQDIHHFQVLGKQQYERYKDFGAEQLVIQAGGVFCPNAGCGEAMFVDDRARTIQCSSCQFEFCRDCRQEIHSGECRIPDTQENISGAIGVDRERAMRSRWDAQSYQTIRQTTKSCPKCRVKTEKSGGCMHMKCSRCGSGWCWICEKQWNRTCQGDHWFG